jgi:hypothetical protein
MFDNLIKTIPPITRTLLLITLIGMILNYTGYINRYDMYFSISKILQGQVKYKYIIFIDMEINNINVLNKINITFSNI